MPVLSFGPLGQFSVRDLANTCRLDVRELDRLLRSRCREYHEVTLTTASSGKVRVLHVPSERLKLAQKRTLRWMVRQVAPHPCSACVKGRGTHWAYRRHARHPWMLRLDIANFFPSVREVDVKAGLVRLGARERLANTLVRLVTLPKGLPQGAPTSVAIGDVVLFPLDERLAGLAERHGFTFSRYVDDITLSGGSRLRRFERLTRSIVADLGWKLNEKGGLVDSGQRHGLLGAIVNAKPNVTREYFGDLRSYLRLVAKGREQPDEKDFRKMESRVNWILSVNPDRAQALRPLLERALDTVAPPAASGPADAVGGTSQPSEPASNRPWSRTISA